MHDQIMKRKLRKFLSYKVNKKREMKPAQVPSVTQHSLTLLHIVSLPQKQRADTQSGSRLESTVGDRYENMRDVSGFSRSSSSTTGTKALEVRQDSSACEKRENPVR